MAVGGPEYRRVADVVWRVAPDRVLLRSTSADGLQTSADLLGTAALVWVALDDSAVFTQMINRLAEAGLDIASEDVAAALDQLAAAGWIRVDDGVGG